MGKDWSGALWPKRSFIPAICTLVLFLLSTGCVRYTPSRHELNEKYKIDPSAEYVGPEAFFQYDKEQEQRLTQLIETRLADAERLRGGKYRVGAGDELNIAVQNFNEVSKTVRVDPNGEIALPFVGQISVAGHTIEEVKRIIAGKVADYVVSPQVDVSVSNYGAYKVWVTGAVRGEGGSIPLKGPQVSLLEVLSGVADLQPQSGAVIYLYPSGALKEAPPEALAGKIAPVRSYDPSARISVDVERLYGGVEKKPLYLPIVDGDLIVVPPPPNVQVFGEVLRRGTQQVITKPFLLSSLVAAGGLTFGADVKHIEILRELQQGKKVVLSIDLEEQVLRGAADVRLRDGDIVWVPSHPRRFYQEHTVNFINSLIGAGSGAQMMATRGD